MKTFREFVEGELFGWLSPRGRLYTCSRWGHTDLVLNAPELKSILSDQTLRRSAELKQAYDDAKDRMDAGGHPEWHSYDSMKDALKSDLTDEMYQKGFLRVASRGEDLHFEGKPDAIKNLYQKARDIAEERGGKAHFRPVNYLG